MTTSSERFDDPARIIPRPADPATRGSRTTLAAIAAEAGVSLPTVSKVLNGRSDVASATRERVERLLAERQYLPPRRRAPRRQQLVDLVFNGLDSPWAIQILGGVEEYFYEHDRAVVVSAVRHGNVRPTSGPRSLWTSATHDGVILVTTELTERQWRQLQDHNIPLVVIDPANVLGNEIPSVGATNWAGGMAATEHLLQLGHRRIAMIAGPEQVLCSRARLDGYRFALERAGMPHDPGLVRFGDFQHEGGFRCAGELLDLADPPTAVFAGSDQQALGVYEAARQRGLRIPQDLSVVGFDDLPVARWLSPPLTTVRQPLSEMGRVGAQMLDSLMDGTPLATQRMELSTELIERESTALVH